MRLFLFVLLSTCAFGFTLAQRGSLEVTIDGISVAEGGEISVGVFPEAGFPEMGKQLVGKWEQVSAGKQTILIGEIPAGTYGLAVFQDLNGNRKLNKNLFGYPTEPFGFSNDAKVVVGPPAFENAAVEVVGGKATKVTLRLR